MRILRQGLVVIAMAALAAGYSGMLPVGAAGAAVRRTDGGTGGWNKAIMLSGAWVGALSCSSSGNCGGGGSRAVAGGGEAIVVSQVHGKWGRLLAVRGLAAGKGRPNDGAVNAIACTSPGNCVAVGSYAGQPSQEQAFIVTERRGTWGTAIAVPGLTALNTGNVAGLNQVTCPSAGNCSAVGTYTIKPKDVPLFTVSEVHGVWGNAATVPAVTGLPGQVAGEPAGAGLLACPAPGNCSAAGSYQVEGNSGNQLFVMSQVNGTWGSAIEIPGTAALNTGIEAAVNAIACSSPGNCSAGGFYWTSNQFQDAFVINQVNGTWHRAIEVPGTSRFAGNWISAISCPSDGNCGAGGVENSENSERPFGSTFVSTRSTGPGTGPCRYRARTSSTSAMTPR